MLKCHKNFDKLKDLKVQSENIFFIKKTLPKNVKYSSDSFDNIKLNVVNIQINKSV